jgi:hypothetical protein
MPKRTPEETLKAIEDADVDDEIARVLAMSEADRQAELRAAGYDIDEIHAEADALHARLFGSAAETKEKPGYLAAPAAAKLPAVRQPRPRALFFLAAALSAVVSVAVSIPTAVVVARHVAAPAESTAIPTPAASQPPPRLEVDVAELRRKSFEACDDGRWVECLYGLDRARHADPAGDAEPRVLLARREAEAGLFIRHDARPNEVDSKAPPKKR